MVTIDYQRRAAYLAGMEEKRAYLDYNATGRVKPAVVSAMADVLAEGGNPSSVHASGRKARAHVEEARAQVAALVGSRARDVIFTSGGTEANNLALRNIPANTLYVSAVEHESVMAAAKATDKPVEILAVDENGIVKLDELKAILKKAEVPFLVSVMLANNETGAIQPIGKISELVHAAGGTLHVDAVQGAGKLLLDIHELGADILTLSAHKFGGPQGVGALVVRPDLPLKAMLVGGGQELGRRSGTENVAGIVGFGVAATLAGADIAKAADIAILRDSMEKEILAIAPDAKVFAKDVPRLPNTSTIAMPGVKGETQVMAMDLAGVEVSSGSACSSGKVKESHVLKAMGAGTLASEAIRVSLGPETTAEDIARFVAAWRDLYTRTRKRQKT